MLENKYLRWHYIVSAIVFTVLITGFMLFKGRSENLYPPKVLEILKALAYIATFVGVPMAYGWFKTFFKSKDTDQEDENKKVDKELETKSWLLRFYTFTFLCVLNSVLFISTFNRSLMFLLIISLMVFLLNKPSTIVKQRQQQ